MSKRARRWMILLIAAGLIAGAAARAYNRQICRRLGGGNEDA